MILGSPRTWTSTSPVILIIDAERDYLTDSVLALSQEGYEVLTAVDSQEVQDYSELYARPIHLVVLDIPLERDVSLEGLLPRQYGSKMVSMIRITRPCCPILLMSATPAWKVSRYRLGASLWPLPFLQRPCSGHDLVQKVRSLLPTNPDSPLPPPVYVRQCV
jgi:DNA-binding response OmpR family regulator